MRSSSLMQSGYVLLKISLGNHCRSDPAHARSTLNVVILPQAVTSTETYRDPDSFADIFIREREQFWAMRAQFVTVQPSIFWGQFCDKGGVVGWVPRGPDHLLPANDWVCPSHTVNTAASFLLRPHTLSLPVHKSTYTSRSRFTPVKISQQSLLGLGG